jgi:hypothetical protein
MLSSDCVGNLLVGSHPPTLPRARVSYRMMKLHPVPTLLVMMLLALGAGSFTRPNLMLNLVPNSASTLSREHLMATGNPFIPTPTQFAELRKRWVRPTQAVAPKGAILAPTAAQFTKIRKGWIKPTQAAARKGMILAPTAAQFAQMRAARKPATQSKPTITSVVVK